MRYINFLGTSFCLLLNVFTLYSSEMESIIFDKENLLRQKLFIDTKQDNPLKKLETYLDNSGSLTLDKAKKVIKQKIKEGEDIVNSQGTSPERSRNNPLEWLCINGSSLEPLTKENRLEIAKFFVENGANDESIKEASLSCWTDSNPYVSEANSTIKEFLDSIRDQRKIIIKNEEIECKMEYKKKISKELAKMMKALPSKE